MMRVLLADDSPHAQRMGERILSEEGFEVVSVTDGETAILRLADVDPDVIIADVFLPKRSGYDLCRIVKTNPRHAHSRVILTAGLLEPFDEDQARGVHYDGVLKKPFEASAMMEAVKPLADAAGKARLNRPASPDKPPSQPVSAPSAPVAESVSESPATESKERRGLGLRGLFERKPAVIRVIPDTPPEPVSSPVQRPEPVPAPRPKLVVKPPPSPAPDATEQRAVVKSQVPAPLADKSPDSAIERYARQFLSKSARPAVDPEAIRAAVTLALDAAMPAMVEEITNRVLAALETATDS
ncbi:MAG: response regulator [Bryobacterales bacterium]|nr:response regulator [Bryobacterales bacterium]